MFRRPWYHIRRQEYSPYFQDNWKVTPRLTVEHGTALGVPLPALRSGRHGDGFDFDKRALVVGTNVDRFIKFGCHHTRHSERAARASAETSSATRMPACRRTWHIGTGKSSAPDSDSRIGHSMAKTFVIRGGYRMSYYPMRLQEWILGQSDSVPVGAAFQNTRQQYCPFSGRTAQLRTSLGTRNTSPESTRRIRSSISTTPVCFLAVSASRTRSEIERRPFAGLELDYRKRSDGGHRGSHRLYGELRGQTAAGRPL